MASLFVIRGRDQGRHFQLSKGRQTIGRDPRSTFQLLDSEVSREHAALISEDGIAFALHDLQSSNGIEVNSAKVDQHRLTSGDRIQIGQTLLIFTGSRQPQSIEAAHHVDIVQQAAESDFSRIVSSSDLSVSAASGDRSLEVMYLTALAVGRTSDLDELLRRVLQLVFDWVVADRGCIMLADPETGELQPTARIDRQPGERVETLAISRTILDYVLENKEGVRTSDAKEDLRWDAGQSIVQGGVREALCVPLQGRYSIVGAMYVDTYTSSGTFIRDGQVGRFDDNHLRLMTAIGYQAALAIEDTYYYSAMMQSERLAVMGQTIANLSHHIKNILQGIRGGSYLIDAGLQREDQDAVRRGWSIVERNQERISNLVMDMLSFSKERQPEKQMADLRETVAEVVELMRSRASELECELIFLPDPDLPVAFFDPDALHRAILNLVTNAIDAACASERPQVVVSTLATSAGEVVFQVADNGPGIPVEDRQKIFSPFESGKGARGTGLGLPVSKKIVDEHGGRIEVDDREGGGAVLRIFLPPPLDDRPETQLPLSSQDTLA